MNSRSLLVIFTLLLCACSGNPDKPQELTEREYYEQARYALNKGEYKEAAELYSMVYDLDRHSEFAGDALYWQAFALYRLEDTGPLKSAARLLERQSEKYPSSSTFQDGLKLRARIYGELAKRGEERAARRLRQITDEDDADETKIAALQALMMMDEERALPILKKIVVDRESGSAEVRRQALMVLGQIRSDETEEILIEVMRNEEDPEVLSEVIMWLSMQGGGKSLDAIVDLTGGDGRLCLLGGLAHVYPAYLADRHRNRLAEPLADALTGAVALAVQSFQREAVGS